MTEVIFPKSINTYMGKKGYTILKSELNILQLNKIKSDLLVKPYVPGTPGNNNSKTFPAYRESVNKIYVPYYYGCDILNEPKQIKLDSGTTINITFNGKLRDNQEIVVKTFMSKILNKQIGGGLLELPCAYGKTVLALNIISLVKKKTLVIVHKEFLMNQWIERITQFLPNAKVGKIQGQVLDIEGKDIVIGMLQSLSMKEYPDSIFNSFGFTIIDEVHHISSEVFSNALFKIVTPYMLGLSATMNRKDGTTKIFKQFLGNVVFKGKRDEERNVQVRGIQYNVNDDEFNEMIYDFRGNPAYSKLISKLCEYNHRSEFILKILNDLLTENNKQQIMILAHNKNLLKYLHDAISHRNIASVGYYVGGMKESALKLTETKQVVIATYAMASEALDIKTLTTLIMATPKTDIEQSVGRILREKHSNPIVVDIIDSHDTFQNQWRKRKVFYKRENYDIFFINSNKYNTDLSQWKKESYDKKIRIIKKTICKKNISSKSFSDKSITSDSDIDSEPECDNNNPNSLKGKCFLSIK